MVQEVQSLRHITRIQTIEVNRYVHLHLLNPIFPFSNGVRVCGNNRSDKMKVDKNYYVSVKDLMNKTLPRPALKKTILVNDGEWLPIVTVETSI